MKVKINRTMKQEPETLFDLIQDATEMLQNMPKKVARFTYSIAKMNHDERAAIVLAYNLLYPKEKIKNDSRTD